MPTARPAPALDARRDDARGDAPDACLVCLLAILFGYDPPEHEPAP